MPKEVKEHIQLWGVHILWPQKYWKVKDTLTQQMLGV